MDSKKTQQEGGRFSLRALSGGVFTVHDSLYGETYHPVLGQRETEELYIRQTGLESALSEETAPAKEPLVVWDVGLGAAGNAMAVLDCWKRTAGRSLHLFSFDLERAALCFALEEQAAGKPGFSYLSALDSGEWELFLEDSHYRCLESGKGAEFNWCYLEGDFVLRSEEQIPRPHLVMYDIFSPPKCPGLFSLEHFSRMKQRVREDGTLVVFHSRSTSLRVTLLLAGWFVGAGCRLADKEETTLALSRPDPRYPLLGGSWLEKVRKSTAAQPLLGNEYRPAPIQEDFLRQLERHPQFAPVIRG